MSHMMVRLKPHNPRRKHLIKTFVHGKSGKKFEEAKGWYRIEESIAEELRSVKQVDGDEYSPDAFDVCTLAEAKRLDAAEAKVLAKRGAGNANDATTTPDLSYGRRRTAIDAGNAPSDRHADARSTRHGSQRGRGPAVPPAPPPTRRLAPKVPRAPRSMVAAD